MTLKTYQDLQECEQDEQKRMAFIQSAIADHKLSEGYKIAADAEEYYAKRNVTISKFQKILYSMDGMAHPDMFSANYKLKTAFFRRFVLQQTQYVLSNGVTFQDENTKQKLGKDFDGQLQKAAKKALVDGVSFLFWNADHVEVFGFADTRTDPGFVPLRDAEDGVLKAGVRYWQVSPDMPKRATLFEAEGFTEYIQPLGEKMSAMGLQNTYRNVVKWTGYMGRELLGGENYSALPIVPLYANDLQESEIVGLRESIDCYDFIKSGFANEIDDTSGFYWVLKNAGGMDDDDIAKFLDRMRRVRAASIDSDDGVDAEAHTLDIPVEARERMLDRLRSDLYEDAMLLDTEKALSGNMTATAIRLAYQQQDDKCGDFEYCLIEAVQRLLELAGIEDNPTFKWNRIANQTEETQMVMTAASELDSEAILKHLPWLTPEEVEEILKRRAAEDLGRFDGGGEADDTDDTPDADEAIDAAEEAVGRTLNGSQTSSLITVIRQLGSGGITEGQAVKILMTSIGVTREEALAIIRGEE